MRIKDIICKRCKENLTKNTASYIGVMKASELMQAHDRVIHQNEYEVIEGNF